jgi:hypothetical protein
MEAQKNLWKQQIRQRRAITGSANPGSGPPRSAVCRIRCEGEATVVGFAARLRLGLGVARVHRGFDFPVVHPPQFEHW